jgi:hypothetical protein
MIIKNFKQFESADFNDFPTFDEVKEYFYDITDELSSNINTYQAGYKFYIKPHRVGEPYVDILKDKSNFIDILKTDITDKKLTLLSNYAFVVNYNGSEHAENELALKAIRDGAKAYRHIMISFNSHGNGYYQSLLKLENYEMLIDCLLTFYRHTEFRPYGDIWTEDYLNMDTGEVETKYGFHGLLVDCSDEEYLKISKLNTSYTGNKNLIKYFL